MPNTDTADCLISIRRWRDAAEVCGRALAGGVVAIDGLIYLTDYDAGLYILQWTGA